MGVGEIIFGVTTLVNLVLAGNHDIYSGYSVHAVKLRDTSGVKLLQRLELELDLDWWEYGVPAVRDALVIIPPDNRVQILDQLDNNGLTHTLHIADVSNVITWCDYESGTRNLPLALADCDLWFDFRTLEEHDESISKWRQSRGNRLVPFENYPRYAEIDAYMERLAAQYPNLVSIITAGLSFGGLPIKYLKISTTNFTDTRKPIYFMNAMLHAREWVTTPVTLYALHRLVEDLREGDRDLLDNTDWIVMPLVNPDGYEYSHTDERLWRRTRSYYPEVSTTCYGVDANRNFNFSWNSVGVSSDPCSNVYPGHEPFSEPETRYVRDVLHEYQERIQIYLDVHSQGNLVLYGYGDGTLIPNGVHIHFIAATMGAAIDALKLPQALYYHVGNSALLLYATSGTAQDYGQVVGVPFSLTLELPGLGYGHAVPPDYIEQINKETWAGIAASARAAVHYYRAR